MPTHPTPPPDANERAINDSDAILDLRAELATASPGNVTVKTKTYDDSKKTGNRLCVYTETTVRGDWEATVPWLGDGEPPAELTDIEIETDSDTHVMAVATLKSRDGAQVTYEINCDDDY